MNKEELIQKLENNGWTYITDFKNQVWFHKPYRLCSFYAYCLKLNLENKHYKIVMRRPDGKIFYCDVPLDLKNILEEEFCFKVMKKIEFNRSIFIINDDYNHLQVMKNKILEDNELCQLIIKKINSNLPTLELGFGVKIYLATYENSEKFLRGRRPFMILHDPDLEEIKKALQEIYTMIKEAYKNGN